jgi:putative radical SAM enzyme (TIGR03279 family)
MVKAAGLLIEQVSAGSIAEELDIEAGDRLLAINGNFLRDIIDYHYYSADDELVFLVAKSSGEEWEIEFDRDPDEPLGLSFETPAPACCGNNCQFCFVHQLPKGLRKPLYVKDEDYRLSFLYGNYVTLTNILPEELARIKEQRLSPLYISVHATDPDIRERLLGRKGLPPVLETMKELAAAGIIMQTQVVLCPGINDGTVLQRTVEDMAALYPQVASLAVVPVGLTRHRAGLPHLEPVTKEYAKEFIVSWQPVQKELEARLGESFLHLADEFYIKAGLPFPPVESYGDFPQLENGVGMIPLFVEEAAELLDHVEKLEPCKVTVVTGFSPYLFLDRFVADLAERTGISIKLVAVPNLLFGEEVTVTGLVSGGDIVAALKGADMEVLLVPDVMLKEGEGVFLDDMSLAGLSGMLRCRAESFVASPEGLYEKLTELCAKV